MKKIIYITSIAFYFSSALAFASGTTNCGEESNYPLITKKELTKVAEEKSAVIFDVNSEESYQKIHVPNSIHYGTHKKDFLSQLPKDKNAMIVAYCGGPTCTAWKTAAEEACKLGYTNIHHFKEGIEGWKKN